MGPECSGGGVSKAKAPGMEHKTLDFWCLPSGSSIEWVAEQWAADVFHMHSDLMSTAGVEVAENQSPPSGFRTVQDMVIRDGRPA